MLLTLAADWVESRSTLNLNALRQVFVLGSALILLIGHLFHPVDSLTI